MKPLSRSGAPAGFTLLELLVGLVIFSVGVLGFVGMTVMQSQANRAAKGFDESATILQSIIEDLNAVQFADLGNDSDLPTTTGLLDAAVWTDGPLNRAGDPIGTGTGAYIYYRSVVVCALGTLAITGGTPEYCGSSLGGANRPSELTCSTFTLTNREKLARVLVSWRDRNGRCHYKNSDALLFSW